MASSNVVDCTLECGHIVPISMVVFTAEWRNGTKAVLCTRCHAMKLVTEWIQHSRGYGLRCTDCRYARYFGLARVTRDIRASSHAVRKRHTVNLMLNGQVQHTVVTDLVENQLELELDRPPF